MPSRPLLVAAAALLLSGPALAVAPHLAPVRDPVTGARTFRLWDGSSVTVAKDGFVTRTENGNRLGGRRLPVFTPPGLDDLSLLRMLSLPSRSLNPQRAAAGAGFWAGSMAIEPRSLEHAAPIAFGSQRAAAVAGLPANYGLRSSLQAHLNAAGVNAIAAFADLARRYGQLPGEGVRITNVSIGDLSDPSDDDFYVQIFGPTTRVIDGQRYLDFPSMPLIPTFTADETGHLDPLGTVKYVDPLLSEVLLDFSVMAPLPSDRQRPEARGDGLTDLLGIAPGADYRLIVPKEPTIANIYVALQAAAAQKPRPDVITASLGFGFDSVGYPGRYLEDDPVGQAVIANIVRQGIVVCISSNDGTRLYTLTAIGPDGGSAPTDRLKPGERPTSTADDFSSTIPTRVADSGAIAVGGTTLDDIFSAPPQAGGPLSRVGQFPETRYNGAAGFSSGYGTRIDIAAPSDGIVALEHVCQEFPCTSPSEVIPVISGGTSASAPMTAAAAAVVIQGARLAKKKLTPLQIRDILVRAGRALAQPPQADSVLAMGPQLDVTAALESVIGTDGAPGIARIAISHRRELGNLGASFREDADPSAIDLSGPVDFDGNGTGQWSVGPITISADVTNASAGLKYVLVIGQSEFVQDTRAFRLLPAEIMGAAGLPAVSADPRNVDFRYEIRGSKGLVASASGRLVFGPSDGLIAEPLAPVAPPVATEGDDVVVQYDISGLRYVDAPTLIVSGIGHWSPAAAPLFHEDTEIPLKRAIGDVRIPASAFRGGAGLYGIAIHPQASFTDVGQIAVIRIAPRKEGRPEAPAIAAGSGAFGHVAVVTRASPKFSVRWDASAIGDGALLEFSAPAPTLRGAYNTYSNANGSRPDGDGVDSPSTLAVPLASAGTKTFDAVALGLPTGIFYNVRILATRGGAPVGEASPSSSFELDDVVVPDGFITSFDLAGEPSLVGTQSFDALGNPTVTSLVRWSPQAAAIGQTIGSDTTGNTIYELFGTDPVRKVSLAARWPWFDSTQFIETWDATAGRLVGSATVDMVAQDWLLTARIDPARHRAAFLGYDPNSVPVLLPFDLAGASFGAPVAAPQDAGFYNLLTLDPVTGKAFLAAGGVTEFCLFRSGPLVSIDLDTGTAAEAEMDSCTTTLVADGKTVHVAHGPLLSNNTLLPIARLQNVDERTFRSRPSFYPGPRSPAFTAVDSQHGILVVGYVASEDVYVNSNATSVLATYDLRTGKPLWSTTAVNLGDIALGGILSPLSLRGVQIDPATRTGWVVGAGLQQLQRFSY